MLSSIRGLHRSKKKIINRTLYLLTFLTLVFALCRLNQYHKLAYYSPRIATKSSSLKEITAKTRTFASNNGVNETLPSNDTLSFRFFSELIGEQGNYIRQLEDGVFNFSSPEELLHYYYYTEMNQYNFEAELQLQAGYSSHNPIYSSEFNDPFNAVRRGYGLESSIFVAVLSSFNDNCAETIKSIFTNAMYPANIFVGVVDGYPGSTEHCIPTSFMDHSSQTSMKFVYSDNIRVRRVRGLGNSTVRKKNTNSFFLPDDPLRFSTLELYRGESYILFIHSGTILFPGWDWRLKLIHSYEISNDNSVLTSSVLSPDKELKEAFEDAVNMSVFSTEKSQRNLTIRTNSDDSVNQIARDFENCPLCLDLLLIPRECVSGHMVEVVRNELESAGGIAFDIMSALLAQNISFPKFSWLIDYNSSTFVDAKKYIYKRTRNILFPQNVEKGSVKRKFFFSIDICIGGFNETEKKINKRIFELCWLEQNIHNLQSLFLEKVMQTQRVEVPVVSSVESDPITKAVSVPRTSIALKEPKYISSKREEVPSLNSFPQRIVSLEFLFSKAEAFIKIPKGKRLVFADLEDENEPEAVSFDPFLPALTPHEADFLISAKLWTSGWNFKRLTEPLGMTIVCKEGSSSLVSTPDENLQRAREVTVERLHSIFLRSSENTTAKIEKPFGLGTQRNLEDFLKFIKLENVSFF